MRYWHIYCYCLILVAYLEYFLATKSLGQLVVCGNSQFHILDFSNTLQCTWHHVINPFGYIIQKYFLGTYFIRNTFFLQLNKRFHCFYKTNITEPEWWPSKGFRSVRATIWREMPAKVKRLLFWFLPCHEQCLGIIAQCLSELGLDMLLMWKAFIAQYFCAAAMFWYELRGDTSLYDFIALTHWFNN